MGSERVSGGYLLIGWRSTCPKGKELKPEKPWVFLVLVFISIQQGSNNTYAQGISLIWGCNLLKTDGRTTSHYWFWKLLRRNLQAIIKCNAFMHMLHLHQSQTDWVYIFSFICVYHDWIGLISFPSLELLWLQSQSIMHVELYTTFAIGCLQQYAISSFIGFCYIIYSISEMQ